MLTADIIVGVLVLAAFTGLLLLYVTREKTDLEVLEVEKRGSVLDEFVAQKKQGKKKEVWGRTMQEKFRREAETGEKTVTDAATYQLAKNLGLKRKYK